MSQSIEDTIHPQVKIFVTMLCEGFNVPNSVTKMQAFDEKLKHPHTPALRETYNIFTDGRASTNKMPTIAEVMEVYKNVVKRLTITSEQALLESQPKYIDHNKSKEMFNTLAQLVNEADPVIPHLIDRNTIDWQNGYKFTLTRNEKGQDFVYYHNHPNNDRS